MNVCEHGDHPAQEGKRFCSRECADCELGIRDCQWCAWEKNPPDLGLAISVHAPWAWAFFHAGKDVENRSRSFPRRFAGKEIRGRVWIHASSWPGDLSRRYVTGTKGYAWDCDLREVAARAGRALEVSEVSAMWEMRGAIVGSIEVYGYRHSGERNESRWYIPGSLAILVRDPRPLVTPVPARGQLGFWCVPEPVLEQVRRAV